MADPLSVTASLIAVLQLSATVIQYLKDLKAGAQERVKLRDEIRSTAFLLEILKDRVEDEETGSSWTASIQALAGPSGPLQQLKESLEMIVAKLLPQKRIGRAMQSFFWPFDKSEIISVLNTIERQKSLLSLALQNDHFSLTRAIEESVSMLGVQLKTLQIRDEDREFRGKEDSDLLAVCKWLTLIDFSGKHHESLLQRQNGTGEWLLGSPTFQQWRDGNSRVLWCPGIPGAGKTILASTVISTLHHQCTSLDTGVAFIYFDYKEKPHVRDLLASLAQQLIKQHHTIPDEVRAAHKSSVKSKRQPDANESLRLLCSTIKHFSTVFIVIDALDEYDQGLRSTFLHLMQHLPPEARLLYTSRYLLDIETLIQATSKIDIRATDEDLKIYLEANIQKGGRLQGLIAKEPLLQNKIIETITERAQGMFLVAQLQINLLSKKATLKAVRSALSKLPEELDDTYDLTLERIKAQDKEDIALANKILTWIIFAVRPLSVQELQLAVAAMEMELEEHELGEDSITNVDVLLTVCAGIIIVEEGSQKVRLVHYTTQEYFDKNGANLFPNAQRDLTHACLSYMSLHQFAGGALELCEPEELRDRIQGNPLLLYSTQNWGYHARQAPIDAVLERVLEFLGNRPLLQAAIQAMDGWKDGAWRQTRVVYWGSEAPEVPPYTGQVAVPPRLVIAAYFGMADFVEYFLEQGDDPNGFVGWGDKGDGCGWTNKSAFWRAVEMNHEAVAKILLRRKPDLTRFGWTDEETKRMRERAQKLVGCPLE